LFTHTHTHSLTAVTPASVRRQLLAITAAGVCIRDAVPVVQLRASEHSIVRPSVDAETQLLCYVCMMCSTVCCRYMELNLKSTIIASDCLQSLKTIREDLTVRIMEPGENPRMSPSAAIIMLISLVLLIT